MSKERRTPIDKRVKFDFEGRQVSARELVRLNPHQALRILQRLGYGKDFNAILSEIGGKAGAIALYTAHSSEWPDIESNL